MKLYGNRLFTKNFTLVAMGQIVSIFGSSVLRFSLDLYVLDITGRADIFALVIVLSAIPGILFSPIGGAIADRFNRRNLMVLFDFSSGAVVLLLIVLLKTSNVPVAVIGTVLVVLSVISSMYQPTVQASVPVLVSGERLALANGIVSGVGFVSALAGPVVGGVLYEMVGINTLVGVSCAAFILSALMELFIKMPFSKRASQSGIVQVLLADIKTGIRYMVQGNPRIFKIILIAALLNLFLSPFFIIGVPYILRIIMHSSGKMYGIGMGIGQFSAILGAISAGIFSNNMRIDRLYRTIMFSAFLLLPMAFAVTPFMLNLGYWPSFTLFLASGTGVMLLLTAMSIFVITSIQKETSDEMMGKVMAIITAVAQCAAPIGQLLYGLLFEKLNSAFVPVFAAGLFTGTIALTAKKALKNAGEKPVLLPCHNNKGDYEHEAVSL